MTYCLGLITRYGLVMASDSRTNAGYDQVNVCRKMHIFQQPGERVFIITDQRQPVAVAEHHHTAAAGLRPGAGLATAATMYDAARVIGDQVRRVSDIDRAALEKDDYKFNVHFILGGQVKGQPHDLYLVYPQGNPLCASEDSPFLQIGETQVRPAHPGPRHPLPRDAPGRGRQVRPDLDGLDHALQRHGRPAD